KCGKNGSLTVECLTKAQIRAKIRVSEWGYCFWRGDAMAAMNVEVRELPARLSEMIQLAAAGEEIIITENLVPKAKLVTLPTQRHRVAGLHPGAITASEDFDAPLPDQFWNNTP